MKLSIEERLKRLERINGFLLLLLAGTTVAWWRVGTERAEAAEPIRRVVTDSIETHYLRVVSPYGKQRITLETGVDGSAVLAMDDEHGDQALSLFVEQGDGAPSICVAFHLVCRVVVGDVQRGDRREFNVQVRDSAGNPIWMPASSNPAGISPRGGPGH